MELPSWLELIDKWAVPLVFLLALVWWLKPKIDQLWDRAMGRSDHASVAAKHMKIILHVDKRIGETLMEMLNAFECDWATLWQYHNGAVSLSGFPFLKVSATHQRHAPGNRMWAEAYQNIPTSLTFCPSAFEDNGQCKKVTIEEADNFGIRTLMHSHGVGLMYVCPIYNTNGLHVACLGLSFKEALELDEFQLRQYFRYASHISTFLEIRSVVPAEGGDLDGNKKT